MYAWTNHQENTSHVTSGTFHEISYNKVLIANSTDTFHRQYSQLEYRKAVVNMTHCISHKLSIVC